MPLRDLVLLRELWLSPGQDLLLVCRVHLRLLWVEWFWLQIARSLEVDDDEEEEEELNLVDSGGDDAPDTECLR